MLNRLFQIVYLLMGKPQMTAKELADIFEVSQRTIYRDIDKLTMAGITIYTNQGKHGGVSILPDYVLDAIAFTIKMSYKGSHKMDGYFSYVVPPLEGLWWQKDAEAIDYSHK